MQTGIVLSFAFGTGENGSVFCSHSEDFTNEESLFSYALHAARYCRAEAGECVFLIVMKDLF